MLKNQVKVAVAWETEKAKLLEICCLPVIFGCINSSDIQRKKTWSIFFFFCSFYFFFCSSLNNFLYILSNLRQFLINSNLSKHLGNKNFHFLIPLLLFPPLFTPSPGHLNCTTQSTVSIRLISLPFVSYWYHTRYFVLIQLFFNF